jgi:CelD/BcsL family acetyltransferase involved in cellulose biosynthesis
MDIAVSYQPIREQVAPAGIRSAVKIARVEVFDTMAGAEPFWRRLENARSLSTSYQRFDLLAAWQRHVGSCSGVTPFIVTGFDPAGDPLFVWPFGLARKGVLRLIRFLGSKHSNFNLGVWRRDILPLLEEGAIRGILEQFKTDADLVVLCNQPLSWDGAGNPFALLAHQASVDVSASLSLRGKTQQAVVETLSPTMRSRLRNKERKLEKLANYRYICAASTEDIDRLLNSFFALKASHLAAQGLGNVFDEPGVAGFLREACHCKLADHRPLIEIHALESANEVLALFGAVIDDYRCSSMFNTYTLGDNARYSPGLVLLGHMINECHARGVQSFDIGVGRAHYKSYFCRDAVPLFDTFVALTPRGRLATTAFAAAFSAKRAIKQNDTLWAAVQTWRRVRARN